MSDEKLQNYFNFNEADLQANKEGHFSQNQKDRLSAMDQADVRGNKITGVLALLVALLGVGFAIWGTQSLELRCVSGLALPVVFVTLGVYLLVRKNAKRAYKLGKAQGTLTYSRHVNQRTRNKVYGWKILHVGKTKFDVGENLSDLMHEGDQYLVFYYPRKGMSHILSAELMANETGDAEGQP
jgi:hypothetical protein